MTGEKLSTYKIRKKTMLKRSQITSICLVSLIAITLASCLSFNESSSTENTNLNIGEYISGGRNVNSASYINTPGFPGFSDKAKWLGTVTGSWSNMGKALGEKSGEYIKSTVDIWWPKICQEKGYENTLRAMRLYNDQIAALDPNQIKFLDGIAEGASPWLDKSEYADKSNKLYADNYTRVLCASIWDVWLWGDPVFQTGDNPPGCNSLIVSGTATIDGKTISTQSQHTPHEALCYQEAYVLKPDKGNIVWTVGNLPSTSGLLLVNNKGVSIAHHFGGATNPKSLEYPGGPYLSSAFGVPWLNVLLYAAVNADTAKEAIDLITVGPKGYRDRTGRASLLRDGGWNWMVADSSTMAVVEVTCDRYAIRYPGEFTGPNWKDQNFIVSANHFLCDYSYDKNNERTDVPMNIFNVTPGSEERFWTLMWDIKDRFGSIDRYVVQHILSTTYVRDKETGEKIYATADDSGKYVPFAYAKWGVQGTMDQGGLAAGTNSSKIAILDGENTMTAWTLGNPSDWEGAWDEFYFDRRRQFEETK
jgi:hypothetical protein